MAYRNYRRRKKFYGKNKTYKKKGMFDMTQKNKNRAMGAVATALFLAFVPSAYKWLYDRTPTMGEGSAS